MNTTQHNNGYFWHTQLSSLLSTNIMTKESMARSGKPKQQCLKRKSPDTVEP